MKIKTLEIIVRLIQMICLIAGFILVWGQTNYITAIGVFIMLLSGSIQFNIRIRI